MDIQIVSIQFENIRGFYNSTLPLDRKTTVLIGPNNSGKTSALRLLDWIVNNPEVETLDGLKELSQSAQKLLLPARTARHKARRITIAIKIPDGRSRRRFGPDENELVHLRIGVSISGAVRGFLKLGLPTRGENRVTDPLAVELLKTVQRAFEVIYIPSARDATSSDSTEQLQKLFFSYLRKQLDHSGLQGGSSAEYRATKGAVGELNKLASDAISEAINQIFINVGSNLYESAKPDLEIGITEFLEWFSQKSFIRAITGDHDDAGVMLSDLGSGLQSLIMLAVAQMRLNDIEAIPLLIVEEPEAFLHPSSERKLAQLLFSDQTEANLIISTHSTIFVDESKYEDLVCFDGFNIIKPRFYGPDRESRHSINSYLLNGAGSEMVFSSHILLVEGPGDRNFFEALRRRLSHSGKFGEIDSCYVLAVGGVANFAPWMKLINDLNSGPQNPKRFLVCPDSDDIPSVKRGLRDASYSLSAKLEADLNEIGEDKRAENWDSWKEKSERFALAGHDVPLLLLAGDLENTMLSECSLELRQKINSIASVNYESTPALLKGLGSKTVDGSGGKLKAPWIRTFIGSEIDANEISASTTMILNRWLAPDMSAKKFKKRLLEYL